MKTALVWMLLCTSLGVCQAQKPDEAPPEKQSLNKVASELRPTLGKVRFHREEQFEDRFLPRRLPGDAIWSGPRIYRVEAEPTIGEVVTGGVPTMYVAVSQASSHVYKLAGFDSAESDFANLIAETPEQRIQTIYGAESRGLLCAEIVYGLSPSWWVNGESSVKLKAAEHFFAEAHPDGLLLAASWWKTAKGDRKHLKIFTEAKGDGYELKIFQSSGLRLKDIQFQKLSCIKSR